MELNKIHFSFDSFVNENCTDLEWSDIDAVDLDSFTGSQLISFSSKYFTTKIYPIC